MKYSNIRQRINFYLAGKAIATAALSAIPGFGEAIDIAGIITGLATGNFTEAALSALGLILPGVSGSSFKAGKEVVEALGKDSALKIGKQLTKKLNPETLRIIKESLDLSPEELKKIGQEIIDGVSFDSIAKKIQTPQKGILRITELKQLQDPNILKQFKLTKSELTFLLNRLLNYLELSRGSKISIGALLNDAKAATSSASEMGSTLAAKKLLNSGTNPGAVNQVLLEKEQQLAAERKAKALRDKQNKTLTSKSGVKFNAGTRFQGIPFYKDNDQLEKHIDVWLKHVEDEYLGLADDLVARGDLIKEGTLWKGRFGKNFKKVNPVDYVMAHSKAFQTAGLQFSGTTYYSGMTSQPYNQFVKNGGTGAPMGIWTTSKRPVAEYYALYSQSGRKSDGAGHVIDVIGPRINLVERLTGSTASSFDALGRPVAEVAKDNPNALHVFSDYIDDLVLKEGRIKTVVYPTGTQVKSLRFNNGDFAMSNYFPFSRKGGIINYYEYVCN